MSNGYNINLTKYEIEDENADPHVMIPILYTVTEDQDSLMLQCLACGESWCEHIEEVLTGNLDGEVFWAAHFSMKPTQESFAVPVPITPTIKQWTAANLVRLAPESETFKIVIPLADGDQTVGFLSSGEGRMILRETIIQWFFGYVELNNLRTTLSCTNPTHGWNAENKWAQDMTDTSGAFAQLWSVFTTHKCLVCSGLDRFRDDPTGGGGVVPDDTSRSWSDLVPNA